MIELHPNDTLLSFLEVVSPSLADRVISLLFCLVLQALYLQFAARRVDEKRSSIAGKKQEKAFCVSKRIIFLCRELSSQRGFLGGKATRKEVYSSTSPGRLSILVEHILCLTAFTHIPGPFFLREARRPFLFFFFLLWQLACEDIIRYEIVRYK